VVGWDGEGLGWRAHSWNGQSAASLASGSSRSSAVVDVSARADEDDDRGESARDGRHARECAAGAGFGQNCSVDRHTPARADWPSPRQPQQPLAQPRASAAGARGAAGGAAVISTAALMPTARLATRLARADCATTKRPEVSALGGRVEVERRSAAASAWA
jgi:hypothetical protein